MTALNEELVTNYLLAMTSQINEPLLINDYLNRVMKMVGELKDHEFSRQYGVAIERIIAPAKDNPTLLANIIAERYISIDRQPDPSSSQLGIEGYLIASAFLMAATRGEAMPVLMEADLTHENGGWRGTYITVSTRKI